MRIKVAIFEDDAVRLNGLQMLLNTADGFECTGAFDNAINVINKIIVSSPDVVIMDIGLPSVNGIDAVKEIKQEFPYLPVLMQTVFDKDEKIFESIMAGATGYFGEGQSAVARLTGEKKNHPGAQYANRLSPRVGRFINAAGTTGFPTGKRAVSATQLM